MSTRGQRAERAAAAPVLDGRVRHWEKKCVTLNAYAISHAHNLPPALFLSRLSPFSLQPPALCAPHNLTRRPPPAPPRLRLDFHRWVTGTAKNKCSVFKWMVVYGEPHPHIPKPPHHPLQPGPSPTPTSLAPPPFSART